MTIEYVSNFKLNPETGEITHLTYNTGEFLTSLQLQSIIYTEVVYVYKNKVKNHFRCLFLKTLFDGLDDLYYINNGGASRYIYLCGDETKFNILQATNARNQPTRYPYHIIPEEYNVSTQPIRFQLPDNNETASTIAKQLKYTFGIEFETAGGVIPEDKCFGLGLVPLRDGSITGIEYTTIPLSNRNISLLKQQVECLKYYTTTNDTCSMHMHFGRLPNDLKYHYVLYMIFSRIEYQFEKFLPDYTFKTDKYKSNGKNYCAHLPKNLDLPEFYNWISGGITLDMSSTAQNLKHPHPADESGHRKWNIMQRYYSMNLINALFYNRNKTVEFRFLKPSYNINFIINWIYLFTAILKTAESFYNLNELRNKTFRECNVLCTQFFNQTDVDINLCINTAYTNPKIKDTLFDFLSKLATVTKLQRFLGDNIGLKTQFHDIYFKTNPID